MADILIRGIDVETRDALKRRAAEQHRSMNELLLWLVDEYLSPSAIVDTGRAVLRVDEGTPQPRNGARGHVLERREVTPRFKR